MLVLLSILTLTLGKDYDTLYTENLYAEQTDCSGTRQLVCFYCNTNYTYTVDGNKDFQIEGLFQSELDIMYSVIDDLEVYINGTEYVIALGNSSTCISIGEISNTPDYSTMFVELMEVEYSDQDLAFITDEPLLTQVLANTKSGVSQDYYLMQLVMDFETSSTVTYLDRIDLTIEKKLINLYQHYGYLEYEGSVQAGSVDRERLNSSLCVSVPYTNEEINKFKLTINVDTEYTMQEWVNGIAETSGCSEIQSPKGLEYLQNLPVSHTVLWIENNSSSQETSLLSTIVYIIVPDFSITTGVYLSNLSGTLYIKNNDCEMHFSGTWENSIKNFLVDIGSGLNESYTGQAIIKHDPKVIKLEDLENLMKNLYPDSNSILPQYSEDSALNMKLYETSFFSPSLSLNFDPEVDISVTGIGKIADYKDCFLSVYFSRYETVIDSYGFIENISEQALNVLHDLDWLKNDGVSFKNGNLQFATRNISYGENSTISPGTQINSTLFLSQRCFDLEFCSIIAKGLNGTSANVSSIYFPSDFYYSSSLQNLTFSSLVIYDNFYYAYFAPQETQFISGFFDISGDWNSELNFQANITTVSGDAFLAAKMTGTWKSVLNITSLEIPLLDITADINLTSILSSSAEGKCEFVDSTSSWPGDIMVSLNIKDYNKNFFVADMYPTSAELFFKFITLKSELDSVIATFNFSAGCTIEYSEQEYTFMSEGFYLNGPTEFMGLPCSFTAKTLELTETLNMTVYMPGFTCGENNIRVSEYSEKIVCDVLVGQTNSSATFTAEIRLFGISQVENMAITGEYFEFSLEGKPFDGAYGAYLEVSAPMNGDIQTAEFTVDFNIDYKELESMSTSVSEYLNKWIQVGLDVLEDSENTLEQAEQTLQGYSDLLCSISCPLKSTCVSDFKNTCTKQLSYDCTIIGDVCSSVNYTCTETENACLDDACEYTADLCQYWNSTCDAYTQGGCDQLNLTTIGKECLESIYACETEELSDSNCEAECEFNKIAYSEYLGYYDGLNENYIETFAELSGFKTLSETSQLFAIYSASSVVPLNETGIGPSDIEFTVKYSAYSILETQLVNLTVNIKFDFYNEDRSNLHMFNIIKNSIIDNSGGTLSEELKEYTPMEVAAN
ncbi:unnamed protein product [Blepharisma stoltei]|uniref:Uncharacterized protein n=1 Tax=Blepharisma stoltei TaxID=1481888 RepID=A0AAU9IAP2_9CILI|nr:unnamed protein product [Blepharisma stoltei]